MFSFGRTLGACLVLAGAWQGGLAAGAVLGVTIGLSMDLAGSGVPLYAMAWGLAALAAGAFRGKKRVWAAAAFAAGGRGRRPVDLGPGADPGHPV